MLLYNNYFAQFFLLFLKNYKSYCCYKYIKNRIKIEQKSNNTQASLHVPLSFAVADRGFDPVSLGVYPVGPTAVDVADVAVVVVVQVL